MCVKKYLKNLYNNNLFCTLKIIITFTNNNMDLKKVVEQMKQF